MFYICSHPIIQINTNTFAVFPENPLVDPDSANFSRNIETAASLGICMHSIVGCRIQKTHAVYVQFM